MMTFIRQLGKIFCIIIIFLCVVSFFLYLFPERIEQRLELQVFLVAILYFVFSVVLLRFLTWIQSFAPQPKEEFFHEKYKIIDSTEKELPFKTFISNWKFEKFSKFKLMTFISGLGYVIFGGLGIKWSLTFFDNYGFDSIEILSLMLLVDAIFFYVGFLSLYLLFNSKKVR